MRHVQNKKCKRYNHHTEYSRWGCRGLVFLLMLVLTVTTGITGCGGKTAGSTENTDGSAAGIGQEAEVTDKKEDQGAEDTKTEPGSNNPDSDADTTEHTDISEPDADGTVDVTEENPGSGETNTDTAEQTGEEQPGSGTPGRTDEVSGTPFERYGKLSVSGTTLADQKGNVVQLKGVSTAGMAWFPQYVNKEGFRTMRDEWGIEIIRLAMYTAEYGGYCVSDDKQKQKMRDLVDEGVAAATELGLYVIIDWHILSDNNPNTHKSEAIAFFDEMARKYGDYDNVIYEICNEPNGGTSWADIKSYAEEVIPVIRKYNSDAIVVVGTPTWSQDVDKAAENPITGYDNIMYALHYYAATHKDDLRKKLAGAIQNGLPIFVTEYGICDASGNGSNDEVSAALWMQLLDEWKISSCMWSLSNKNETCAFFTPDNKRTAGWTQTDLTASGKWFVNMMQGSLDLVGTTGITGEEAVEQAGSGNGGGSQMPAQDSFQQASGEVNVNVSTASTWNSEKGCCYQYNVSLTNTGDTDRKNWKLKISFSEKVELDQCWCCEAAVYGTMLVITPKDWNNTLEASKSLGDIGFIVAADKEINIVSVSLE